jgi:hypothetical protein
MAQNGVVTLESTRELKLYTALLASGRSRLAVLEHPMEGAGEFKICSSIEKPTNIINTLKDRVKPALVQTICRLGGVNEADIDTGAGWEENGLEQFKLAKLVDILNEEYGLELTVTGITGHTDLNSFSQYLTKNTG